MYNQASSACSAILHKPYTFIQRLSCIQPLWPENFLIREMPCHLLPFLWANPLAPKHCLKRLRSGFQYNPRSSASVFDRTNMNAAAHTIERSYLRFIEIYSVLYTSHCELSISSVSLSSAWFLSLSIFSLGHCLESRLAPIQLPFTFIKSLPQIMS